MLFYNPTASTVYCVFLGKKPLAYLVYVGTYINYWSRSHVDIIFIFIFIFRDPNAIMVNIIVGGIFNFEREHRKNNLAKLVEKR